MPQPVQVASSLRAPCASGLGWTAPGPGRLRRRSGSWEDFPSPSMKVQGHRAEGVQTHPDRGQVDQRRGPRGHPFRRGGQGRHLGGKVARSGALGQGLPVEALTGRPREPACQGHGSHHRPRPPGSSSGDRASPGARSGRGNRRRFWEQFFLNAAQQPALQRGLRCVMSGGGRQLI